MMSITIATPARDAALPQESAWVHWFASARRGKKLNFFYLFLAFFLLTAALQFAGGIFHEELSDYPDEPAHYVTGLMVREYIATGLFGDPLQFAENYYLHYPKVAFGHWPPLFYILQAGWTLVFSPSRASILLFMAVITALNATVLALYMKRLYGWIAALVCSAFLISMPLVQMQTGMIMSETLLALVSFLSAASFGRYLESERWQDSLWFGLFASLSILTKGSGWCLALIPPVAILLTGKWMLVKRWSFWSSAILVGALCVPWQMLTMKLAQHGWYESGGSYTLGSVKSLLHDTWASFSPGVTLLALVGMGATVLLPLIRRKPVASHFAAMFAFVAAVWSFHSVIPVGAEARRVFMGFPGLLVFVPAGVLFLAGLQWMPALSTRRKAAALAGVALALYFGWGFSIPRKISFGFSQAAALLLTTPEFRDSNVLISSEGDGEGIFITEVAMRQPVPQHYLIRASKLLASCGWNGDHYAPRVHSQQQVREQLDLAGIDLVVLDTNAGRNQYAHHALVRSLLEENPAEWQQVDRFTSARARGNVIVYRRLGRKPTTNTDWLRSRLLSI